MPTGLLSPLYLWQALRGASMSTDSLKDPTTSHTGHLARPNYIWAQRCRSSRSLPNEPFVWFYWVKLKVLKTVTDTKHADDVIRSGPSLYCRISTQRQPCAARIMLSELWETISPQQQKFRLEQVSKWQCHFSPGPGAKCFPMAQQTLPLQWGCSAVPHSVLWLLEKKMKRREEWIRESVAAAQG